MKRILLALSATAMLVISSLSGIGPATAQEEPADPADCVDVTMERSGSGLEVTIAFADPRCEEWDTNVAEEDQTIPGQPTNQMFSYIAYGTGSNVENVTESLFLGTALSTPNIAGESYTYYLQVDFEDDFCIDDVVDVDVWVHLQDGTQTGLAYEHPFQTWALECNGISVVAEYRDIWDLSGEAGVTDNHSIMMRLYWAVFDRVPDEPGVRFWIDRMSNGCWNVRRVAQFFTESPEFEATYGDLSDDAFITLVYNNVLDRNPDAGGFEFWQGKLDSGTSRAEMILLVSDAPEFRDARPLLSDGVSNQACGS